MPECKFWENRNPEADKTPHFTASPTKIPPLFSILRREIPILLGRRLVNMSHY